MDGSADNLAFDTPIVAPLGLAPTLLVDSDAALPEFGTVAGMRPDAGAEDAG